MPKAIRPAVARRGNIRRRSQRASGCPAAPPDPGVVDATCAAWLMRPRSPVLFLLHDEARRGGAVSWLASAGPKCAADPAQQTAAVCMDVAGNQFEKAAGFPDRSILCLNIIVA